MSDPAADRATSDSAILLEYLAGRDTACAACGYNLRDLREPRCPECGETLTLRVQPTEPKIGWPLAGLVGISCGAGFSLLMTIYFVLMFGIIKSGSPPRDVWQTFWGYVFLPLLFQAAALAFWLRRWRQIRQLPVRSKCGIVLAAWLLPLLNIVLFTINIR